MMHFGENIKNERSPQREPSIFKSPGSSVSRCTCTCRKIIARDGKSSQSTAIDVAFSQEAHLNAFNIIKFSSEIADFKSLSLLVDKLLITDVYKNLADPKFYPLAQGFCESFLRLHPPCIHHTFKSYLQLLESPVPDSNQGRFLTLFTEMVIQLEFTDKKVMPSSSRSRQKVRKNYAQLCTKGIDDFVQRVCTELSEEPAKKYGELQPFQRLNYLFTAFSVFVEIIERDFREWMRKLSAESTNSGFYRPLIVELLWKDIRRFDEDAVMNKLCEKMFRFYVGCQHNNVSPGHLKVVARLINVISDVVELMARHQEAKPEDGFNLASDFKNFYFQPRIENGFHGFALKEIENGRRKIQKPILYHMDETTIIGSLCRRYAEFFVKALRRCTCENENVCQFWDRAFIFLKPPWLLYLATSCLLNEEAGIAALVNRDVAEEARRVEAGTMCEMERNIRSIMISSAVDTLQMLGYRSNRPRKDVQRVAKRIKLDPSILETKDDVDEVMTLIKGQNIMVF